MNSLSNQKKIKGSLAASLTAFKEDLSLDYNKTISHGEWLLEQGLDGVVFFGTTGEGNSLNVDEKKEFIDQVSSFRARTESDNTSIKYTNGSETRTYVRTEFDIHSKGSKGNSRLLLTP